MWVIRSLSNDPTHIHVLMCRDRRRTYLFSSSSWLASSSLSFCVLANMALTCWRVPSFSVTYCVARSTNTPVSTVTVARGYRLSYSFTWLLPGRAASSPRSAPSPRHWCGWWLWPSRLAPGLSPPAAARCAAASPSGPPAAPWCPRSYGRNVTTSPSAEEGKRTSNMSRVSGQRGWGHLVTR